MPWWCPKRINGADCSVRKWWCSKGSAPCADIYNMLYNNEILYNIIHNKSYIENVGTHLLKTIHNINHIILLLLLHQLFSFSAAIPPIPDKRRLCDRGWNRGQCALGLTSGCALPCWSVASTCLASWIIPGGVSSLKFSPKLTQIVGV